MLVATGVLVVAALFAAWAAVDLSNVIKLERNGVVVAATVVSVEHPDDEVRVRVEFATRSGLVARSVLDENALGGGDAPPVGARIDVRYVPENPNGRAVKATRGFRYTYLPSILVGVLAAGIAGMSIVLFRRSGR
ncbi:DUF3592 domain-containing protein [Spirillospora sp. NPDC047279]|uniref:DUF3592 domain-containing protein n=1 Tax=Spirillospora sp. NPDC047279 TaxID=3155478 RepID=UPI003410BBE8